MEALVSCKVTACDRNGLVYQSLEIQGKSTDWIVQERTKAFWAFRNSFPDCQIYFNWKGSEEAKETINLIRRGPLW